MIRRFIGIIESRHKGKLDAHAREVLSGTMIAFALRGIGAGLAFLFNVAIARILGANGAGIYFLALSITMIASVVARVGLDNALLRFIATHSSQGEWGEVKGVFRLGMRIILLTSVPLSLLFLLLAPWIANVVFDKVELGAPLRWMSVGIVTFSFMMLLGECLKGLKKIAASMAVSGVIYAAFGLVLIWPLATVMGVAGASLTYVVATGSASLIGLILWRQTMAAHPESTVAFRRDTLRASAQPLFLMSILNRAVLPWAPLFLLGIWGSSEEIGIFGAASRISMLVTFFLTAVNTVIAPKFAELYANGDHKTLGRLARNAALFTTLLASPIFLLLIFKGDWVMSGFGPEFINGGAALAILAVGQAINTLTGSVGSLLMMTGHETDARNSAIVGAVLVVGLSVMLIPNMGMIGAALASAVATGGMNMVSVYYVWRRLGVMTVPFVKR